MPLLPDRARDVESLRAALSGRYTIERELGAGGMATVYLAHDVKHDRKVAVKVLHPELAAVLGAERFVQEIKTTANLQHPNILPLFDSGRTGGQADGREPEFLYYVMPYVEGETLRDKLNRETQLGIGEAVRITVEVADALDYAHRNDVIHRDIKPENILLHDGRPVVADFGIALAVSAAAGGRMTETGLSLGTPHYMSPEQATADKQLSNRSDVYSLGAVLYEMLSGEPPHTGSSGQQIIMKIVTEQPPPVTTLRKAVPPNVAAATAKALEKLPADRFDSAAKFAEALENPSFTLPTTTATKVPALLRQGNKVSGSLLVLTLVATAVALWGWLRPASGPVPTARLTIDLPEGSELVLRTGSPLALSPDGTRLVYTGESPTGGARLYLRALDRLEPAPIAGTELSFGPFFSPDGQEIAFFSWEAPRKLKRIAVAGGSPITIVDSVSGVGGSWMQDGRIIFADARGGLSVVDDGGGVPDVLTVPDAAGGSHRWPVALPGGRAVLFTHWYGDRESAEIAVLDLQTREVKTLLQATHATHTPTGHLVHVLADGTLAAAPFDLRSLEVTGPSIPFPDGVSISFDGSANLALSNAGSLAYMPMQTADSARLVLVDRDGVQQRLIKDLRGFRIARFSPDGNRIAVTIRRGGAEDVWIYDLGSETLDRLTTEGANNRVAWSADGTRVAYVSDRNDRFGVYWKAADFSGSAELLFESEDAVRDMSFSPDGRWLVYRSGAGRGRDIFGVPLEGERTPQPLLVTPFQEYSAMISPDGKWLAYGADRSGRREIYIQPFPDLGGRTLVSTDGGISPVWGPSGQELFYRANDTLVVATLDIGSTVRVSARQKLFDVSRYAGPDTPHVSSFDAHPDGKHLLMVEAPQWDRNIIVVLHWFTEVNRLLER